MPLESEVIFVSHTGNECIQVYDLNTATCLKGYRGLSTGLNSLNILRDNYVVASQKERSILQVWPINKHALLDNRRFPIQGKANVVAISPNSPYVCAIGIDEQIHLYNMISGRQIAVINRHYQFVSCLAFSPCCNYFASAGHDGFVYLWSMESIYHNLNKSEQSIVEPRYVLGKHCDKVTGIAMTGFCRRDCLVSCSLDFTLKVYSLRTGELTHNIVTSLALTCVALNSYGSLAYLGSRTGKIIMIPLSPPSESRDKQINDEGTQAHESVITCIETNRLADTVVTGGADGEVKLWHVSFELPKDRKHFDSCSFYYTKSLIIGRGTITNVKIAHMDASLLTKLEHEQSTLVASFNNDIHTKDSEMLLKRQPNQEDFKLSVRMNEAIAKLKVKPVQEEQKIPAKVTHENSLSVVLVKYHSKLDEISNSKRKRKRK